MLKDGRGLSKLVPTFKLCCPVKKNWLVCIGKGTGVLLRTFFPLKKYLFSLNFFYPSLPILDKKVNEIVVLYTSYSYCDKETRMKARIKLIKSSLKKGLKPVIKFKNS